MMNENRINTLEEVRAEYKRAPKYVKDAFSKGVAPMIAESIRVAKRNVENDMLNGKSYSTTVFQGLKRESGFSGPYSEVYGSGLRSRTDRILTEIHIALIIETIVFFEKAGYEVGIEAISENRVSISIRWESEEKVLSRRIAEKRRALKDPAF